jgi:8-oxo-dGTP diphosphatase
MEEFWDIVDENGRKTGHIHKKGEPMRPGEYHLGVTVWVLNAQGQFLISQRAAGEHDPLLWHSTEGSARQGEEGLSAALREVKEELGISLLPQNGSLYKAYTYPHKNGSGAAYIQLWLFRQDFPLSSLALDLSEVCAAAWATENQIRQMVKDGTFLPYDYLEELFAWARASQPKAAGQNSPPSL